MGKRRPERGTQSSVFTRRWQRRVNRVDRPVRRPIRIPPTIVALIFFLAVPIPCAGAAVHSYDIAATLRDHGQVATATVVKIENPPKGSDYAIVNFITGDGRKVSAELKDLYKTPDVGQTVVVRYAPEDPENYIQDVRQKPHFEDAWIWGICSAVAALFVAITASRWMKKP